MDQPYQSLLNDLKEWAKARGIEVHSRRLPEDEPAQFDGPTVTLDPRTELDGRCFYLAHALGSIAQWSTDFDRVNGTRDALRDAKKERDKHPKRFEQALHAYLRFEEQSSEHAVWLLGELGHAAAIEPYTVFFRADLESMTQFHRTGTQPVWREFFPEWKRRVAAGEVEIRPFPPRPIPPFQPVRIPKQEVIREEDGD